MRSAPLAYYVYLRKETPITDNNAREVDTDQDRYPNIYDVLATISEEDDLPQGPIERLEVTCLANGEATYKVWPARAEEPEGGVLPPA